MNEMIKFEDWYELPRYFYHKPPTAQVKFAEKGLGLEAYPNKNHDGSTPSIERAFKEKDPKILWLSPKQDYGEAYKVDLTKLDLKNVEPTGQFEGNICHKGDIPPEAVVGKFNKEGGEYNVQSQISSDTCF